MMMRRRLIAAIAALAGVAIAASAALGGSSKALPLGPVRHAAEATYLGYYDGHKDTFVATDSSNKAQAKAMHINYSPELASVKHLPRQFFIEGRAAHGQLSVFGSEPGESDYNPLWDEIGVVWKPGAKPVLLVKDDQIDSLAKQGKLVERDLGAVLNAPIIKVG
jgi:hypothetical protein